MDSITLTVNGQQINVSQTNIADLVNKYGFDVVVALLEEAISLNKQVKYQSSKAYLLRSID